MNTVEMTNPATGQKIRFTSGRWGRSETEINPKFAVEGLKAFDMGSMIRFELRSVEKLDESNGIDAQCRAGWNDQGFGFFGFSAEQDKLTGIWTGKWSCSKSSE